MMNQPPGALRGHVLTFGSCSVAVTIETIGRVLQSEELDGVVSSDDTVLSMSGGVAMELKDLAGESYVEEARAQVPVALGSVAVTSGGLLPVRHVLHAITVDWEHDVRPNERTVRHLGRELFVRCESLGIRTVAIPAIASGSAGFAPQKSAQLVAAALVEHLSNQSVLTRVVFALPDPEAYLHFVRELFPLAGQPLPPGVGLEETARSMDAGPRQKWIGATRERGSESAQRLGLPPPATSAAPHDTTGMSSDSTQELPTALRPKRVVPAKEARSWWPFRRVQEPERPTRAAGAAPRDSSARLQAARGASGTPRGSAVRQVLARRYVLLEELGRGGFSVVDLAWDLVLRRTVAIKRMRPETANLALLQHEAAIAMDLSHEGIVRLYHFEPRPEEDGPFLVMEYVPWATGEKWIADAGRAGLPPRVVLEIGLRACEPLAYAHARHVLHLDIKPGNMFVDPAADRVKLVDFGLSRAVESGQRALQPHATGTPAYMSPEQFAPGARVTPAADVYQLTATLWDLLTGEAPKVTGDGVASMMGGALSPILTRLVPGLAADPRQRPADARELARVIEGAMACC